MKAILGLLFLFILINLGLIAVGVAIGFLLHWILRSVDLGTSILISVVATGFSIHYFIRLLKFSEYLAPPRSEDDDELPPIWVYPASTRSARKRKRKST